MSVFKLFVTAAIFCAPIAHAASLKQAFSEGKFQGQIRAYNNTLVFQHAGDKYGTAVGGRLGYETNADQLWGFSLGLGYYTANDLETNKDNPADRAPFTPTVDVDILGEAYARWKGYDTVITAGNQLIDTPFANPADAFLIPVTFTGYSLINKSVSGLTVNAHHLTNVKTREATDFADTGAFVLNRLGSTPRNTGGTSIFGLTYDWNKLKVQGWYYIFPDLFTQDYAQADYEFEPAGNYTPYVSAQYGLERDDGDKLLGDVDSTLWGAKAGVKAFGANLSLGMNHVDHQKFLTPYSYFTDATYTNSMITGMGNVLPGTGWKATLLYDFTTQLWGKLSYSMFDFDGGKDTAEADADLRYKFTGDFDGLSIWLRVGWRDGSNAPAGLADLLEYRTQIQYLF